MSKIRAIDAQIYKVQTTVDGGARITLDLGLDSSEIIARLLKQKMAGDDSVKIVFIKENE